MCLKIRYDGKSEKFCKIFLELNKALLTLKRAVQNITGVKQQGNLSFLLRWSKEKGNPDPNVVFVS
jgi:hypothetical protein